MKQRASQMIHHLQFTSKLMPQGTSSLFFLNATETIKVVLLSHIIFILNENNTIY